MGLTGGSGVTARGFGTGPGQMPREAVEALHAIENGLKAVITADGGVAVEMPGGWCYLIREGALAPLSERGLIEIVDGDDGRPHSIAVTGYGRSWLRRWSAAHGVTFVRKG